MTGQHAHSLVSDLVEMAKAVERVPQLEHEIRALQRAYDHLLGLRQALDGDLNQSREYAATLEQKVRDLEVSRNDAELRFLEADDALLTLKSVLRGIVGEATGALLAVGPQDEPEPELKGTKDAMLHGQEVQVASNMMEAVSVDAPIAIPEPYTPPPSDWAMDHTQGQNEVDPIGEPCGASSTAEPVVSVPSDPTPATTQTDAAPASAPSSVTSEEVAPSDPEPADRWSDAWWKWRDRQEVPVGAAQ